MALVPLKVPPGVFRNGTEYEVGGRWFDANLVRWSDGVIRPVGGWQKLTTETFNGKCRGLFAWQSNANNRFLAIGTSSKLYVWNESSLIDITPTGFLPAREDSVYGLGYGTNTYGSSTYGTSREGVGKVLEAATWTFDNWGEYLVAVAPHEGTIYEWALNSANDAVAVTNAPGSNRGVIVTPERYLVALGAGSNTRKVQWSDQEDRNTWSPSGTNTAGDFELQTTGSIQLAKRVRGQVLILTDVDAHTMTYIGPPFVYSFDRVGSFCGAISPNAAAAIDAFCVWMGKDNFHIYDGVVRLLPCDVRDYVFNDLNEFQRAKVYAGVNPEWSEVWWFYPSANSQENDRYVLWNYRENHWSIGILERTAWAGPTIFNLPIATNASGLAFEHETGWTNDGQPITTGRYAQSGAVQIENGDRVAVARQLLPDEKTQGQTRVQFKTKFTPNGPEQTFGPYSMSNYTDVRFTGRQASLRVEGVADDDWRIGQMRLDVVPGGRR